MRIKVCAESIVLVAICMADMLSTLYFVTMGMATEQNPIMAACFDHSPYMFVFVKTLSFLPFVVAVEYYRRKNPVFAKSVCRLAIGLYLFLFVVLTIGLNIR